MPTLAFRFATLGFVALFVILSLAINTSSRWTELASGPATTPLPSPPAGPWLDQEVLGRSVQPDANRQCRNDGAASRLASCTPTPAPAPASPTATPAVATPAPAPTEPVQVPSSTGTMIAEGSGANPNSDQVLSPQMTKMTGPLVIDGQSGKVYEYLDIATSSSGVGVIVRNSTGITLRNLVIHDLSGHGIQVYGSSNVTIQNITISKTYDGINVLQSQNIQITGGKITDTERQLVIFDKSTGGLVSGVNIGVADAWPQRLGWDGLSSYQSDNITIEGNQVRGGNLDSGCGIIVDGDGGSSNIIRNNVVENMVNCGIGLSDGDSTIVELNQVSNIMPTSTGLNNAALYIWEQYSPMGNCTGNIIRSNTVQDSNPFWNAGNCQGTLISGNSWQ